MYVKSQILIFLSASYALAQNMSSTALSLPSSIPINTLETSEPGVISPNYALRGFKGCSDAQEATIKSAFADMIKMLMSDEAGRYPKVDWNSASAQDFWGSYEFNADVRDHITSTRYLECSGARLC